MFIIMSSTNSTTSFYIWITLLTFSCLSAVVNIFKNILNKSRESGHLCLVSDFKRKAFCFFTTGSDAWGFVVDSVLLRYASLLLSILF